MTREEKMLQEYQTYCVMKGQACERDKPFNVLGYKDWKEQREQIDRPEGVNDK